MAAGGVLSVARDFAPAWSDSAVCGDLAASQLASCTPDSARCFLDFRAPDPVRAGFYRRECYDTRGDVARATARSPAVMVSVALCGVSVALLALCCVRRGRDVLAAHLGGIGACLVAAWCVPPLLEGASGAWISAPVGDPAARGVLLACGAAALLAPSRVSYAVRWSVVVVVGCSMAAVASVQAWELQALGEAVAGPVAAAVAAAVCPAVAYVCVGWALFPGVPLVPARAASWTGAVDVQAWGDKHRGGGCASVRSVPRAIAAAAGCMGLPIVAAVLGSLAMSYFRVAFDVPPALLSCGALLAAGGAARLLYVVSLVQNGVVADYVPPQASAALLASAIRRGLSSTNPFCDRHSSVSRSAHGQSFSLAQGLSLTLGKPMASRFSMTQARPSLKSIIEANRKSGVSKPRRLSHLAPPAARTAHADVRSALSFTVAPATRQARQLKVRISPDLPKTSLLRKLSPPSPLGQQASNKSTGVYVSTSGNLLSTAGSAPVTAPRTMLSTAGSRQGRSSALKRVSQSVDASGQQTTLGDVLPVHASSAIDIDVQTATVAAPAAAAARLAQSSVADGVAAVSVLECARLTGPGASRPGWAKTIPSWNARRSGGPVPVVRSTHPSPFRAPAKSVEFLRSVASTVDDKLRSVATFDTCDLDSGRKRRALCKRTHLAVSVVFSDIVGYTAMSSTRAGAEVLDMLNEYFSRLDAVVDMIGVDKVETVGDAYIVACNLFEPDDNHEVSAMLMAEAMLRVAATVPCPSNASGHLEIRVGVHTGPLCSGILGTKRKLVTLVGDTMNTAARMEQTSRPGCVRVTSATWSGLPAPLQKLLEPESIAVKGKGVMATYVFDPTRDGTDGAPGPAPGPSGSLMGKSLALVLAQEATDASERGAGWHA
ncbi:unnamed protein product [Pedinophyceae sp. YPF-701]|nr:unnamed protein product [Pedinophyceae sp. YPF-701]